MSCLDELNRNKEMWSPLTECCLSVLTTAHGATE
jgi:hypothetical protein